MTFTLTNQADTWTFQPVGLSVYVTQKRGSQTMTACDYTTKEARELWALLVSVGAA